MRTPVRFALISLLLLAALVLAAGRTTPKPAPRVPLRYSDFQKQWNPDRNGFVGPDGQPLYDRAEAEYGQRELDLRAARRANDESEVW